MTNDDEVTLALDTSGGTCVAVLRGGAVLARAERPDPRGHAEHLAPLVRDALAEAGLSAADVTSVAVGTGPAPFTGLRVGLVTAAAFAVARGLPVRGVASLEAWARASRAEARAAGAESVRVVTDARRREVYTASYAVDDAAPGGLRVIEEPRVIAPADLAATVEAERAGGVVLVGPGLYTDVLGVSLGTFDVAELARVANERAAAGEATPTTPLYLRRPDVHGVAGGAV